ncbi:MAG: hypothetical protein JWR84_288 [Caulobacter sp.]|nr:hypothetical protein [Caulobacter sp.]
MRITADTNLLVRALIQDDPQQAAIAEKTLAEAELIAVTVPTLCELVWVLDHRYRLPRGEIAGALRALISGEAIAFDRPAVEAGLAQLESGGDFADGVIAMQGALLGGDLFASFDRRAVRLVKARGGAAVLLGES